VNSAPRTKANDRLARRILFVVVAMFGFGFAMVPFYNVFCELTGLNGKVKNEATAAGNYVVDPAREITLEFVTSLNQDMPLAFRAETSKLKIHPGQYYTVNFYAENLTDRKLVGQAIPSIAPGLFAEHLKKTECFCFSEQEFEPHKERQMPVRFVVDPAIPKDVKDLTLSYTFFDITNRKQD
jgi:cytochrome c oxidase assembly protein subunit 11